MLAASCLHGSTLAAVKASRWRVWLCRFESVSGRSAVTGRGEGLKPEAANRTGGAAQVGRRSQWRNLLL